MIVNEVDSQRILHLHDSDVSHQMSSKSCHTPSVRLVSLADQSHATCQPLTVPQERSAFQVPPPHFDAKRKHAGTAMLSRKSRIFARECARILVFLYERGRIVLKLDFRPSPFCSASISKRSVVSLHNSMYGGPLDDQWSSRCHCSRCRSDL